MSSPESADRPIPRFEPYDTNRSLVTFPPDRRHPDGYRAVIGAETPYTADEVANARQKRILRNVILEQVMNMSNDDLRELRSHIENRQTESE